MDQAGSLILYKKITQAYAQSHNLVKIYYLCCHGLF